MEKDGWKILAIIFIVLSVILFFIIILESVVLLGVLVYEQDLDDKEIFCDVNICGQYENYSSYVFDEYDEVCYCNDKDGELIHQEVVVID